MKRLQSYARLFAYFCYIIVLPLILISFIYKWFLGSLPLYNDIATYTKKVSIYTGLGFFYQGATQPNQVMLIMVRSIGALIDAVSIGLIVWGCFCFIKLLSYYQRNELFSANTLALFKKISRIAFAWVIYEPIKFTLLSFVTTMTNPVGQRIITIGITSNDVIHICIVGFFWIITSLMHEAYLMKSEQDLTI